MTNLKLVDGRPGGGIRAVTFDAGGTLIEPWPSVGHVYAQIATRHGVHVGVDEINRRFAHAWKGGSNFTHSRAEWARVVDQTFEGLCRPAPSESFFDELYEAFARPEAWRIYDDVLPMLDHLAGRGFKLAIISNWDERLRPLLQELRLEGYFSDIVVSHEVAFTKPSPVIFEYAARKLSLPVEAILHVGDSIESDVQGARAAGLQALHLDRKATQMREGKIKSLRELVSMSLGDP